MKDRFIHLGGLDGIEYSKNVHIRPNSKGVFVTDYFSRKYLLRSCGYLVGRDAAEKLHRAGDVALFRADDYSVIGHEIMPALLELFPCVRHLVDLQSSHIEPHRKIVGQLQKRYLLQLKKEVLARMKPRIELIIESFIRKLFGYEKIRYDEML